MPLDNPRGGLGYSAEFQSSALPWVTSSVAPAAGSPVQYTFDKVTRFVTIYNRDTTATNTMSIGFTTTGVTGSNKYVLNGGHAMTFEVRVKTLWLQGESATPAYSLFVGLTNIDARQMPPLTGSSWTGIG